MMRRIVYRALDALGANKALRASNSGAIRIFTAHGVSAGQKSDSWTPVREQLDPGLLDILLKSLSGSFQFIDMDTVVGILSQQIPPVENAVAISLDDGYSNNFLEALPILEKYNAPAIFYVATRGVLSREPFWFDRLDYALQSAAEHGIAVELAGRTFLFKEAGRHSVRREYSRLRDHAKRAFADDREFMAALDDVAQKIEGQTGKSLRQIIDQDHWSRVVTKGELRQFAQHPLVTIGSHTVSHLRLSLADDEMVERELVDSKVELENWTGKGVQHFAYPNGAFDARAMKAVRMSGYSSAVTSDPGMNLVGQDLMSISRFSIPTVFSATEIAARASGLESFVANVFKRLTKQKPAGRLSRL